jgi:DNA-binding NtrC family response regulator
VPPLRSRADDIPDLARHFVVRFAAEEGKRVRGISSEAMALLSAHGWPGNVRQLENAVFRAVVLAETDMIGVDEFPQIAALVSLGSAIPLVPSDSSLSQNPEPQSLRPEPLPPANVALSPQVSAGVAAPIQPPGMVSLLDAAGEVRPLEEVEAELIRFAIDHYRGQMSEVARRLRIGRSTLYRKLENLDPESSASDSFRVADG